MNKLGAAQYDHFGLGIDLIPKPYSVEKIKFVSNITS